MFSGLFHFFYFVSTLTPLLGAFLASLQLLELLGRPVFRLPSSSSPVFSGAPARRGFGEESAVSASSVCALLRVFRRLQLLDTIFKVLLSQLEVMALVIKSLVL